MPSFLCRDGWLRRGGGLWAVQTEAPREHENVASPDSHACGSPGLRRGSNNVWCAVFNATGVRDKAQGIMEEPKPLSWWWPVYCSYQLNIEGFLREKKYVA